MERTYTLQLSVVLQRIQSFQSKYAESHSYEKEMYVENAALRLLELEG